MLDFTRARQSCGGRGEAIVYAALHVAAWLSATFVGWTLRERIFSAAQRPIEGIRLAYYLLAIWAGAMAGAYGLGTLNLALDEVAGVGRSIVGALFGGVIAAELFKAAFGIRGSTGAMFVVPLALGIAIGRLGCFAAGLEDYTYGIATDAFCGVDFGDGTRRHPVQLYESLAMVGFLVAFAGALRHRRDAAIRWGFYAFVAWYAAQRFVWEFLKPYPAVVGPFNIFHLVCLALLAYAATMVAIGVSRHARA